MFYIWMNSTFKVYMLVKFAGCLNTALDWTFFDRCLIITSSPISDMEDVWCIYEKYYYLFVKVSV